MIGMSRLAIIRWVPQGCNTGFTLLLHCFAGVALHLLSASGGCGVGTPCASLLSRFS
ncbi:hypothetical protein DLM_1460 [Aquitalea magnusonii]|uniref:Uncharacterized protein n=1 Tax=Aquitalea magnusonii TaxID=332411 RepID=A0A3G9GCL3_9NEIS|nr:hypothetical protein DLM_1460 [Aquitalea magnusonii]